MLLFCSDPLVSQSPDEAYAAEAAAAEQAGLEYSLVDYEALVNDADPTRAICKVAQRPGTTLGIYRGWMLRPQQYAGLYESLRGRGITLINGPAAYLHCHHLPEWYPLLEHDTPRSVWMKCGGDVSVDAVMELLRPFGSSPVILKDFVKSQKHYWEEACFIPSASDWAAVECVVRRFLELQGEDLNEGLVFREFVELEPIGSHSRSAMPLTKEYRFFFQDGEPIWTSEYWEEGEYTGTDAPVERFREAVQSVKSRFFTMDVARRRDGEWMIVELGDGQVAGLPEHADVEEFYQALRKALGD